MADTGRHADHDRDIIRFANFISFLGHVDTFLRIGRLEHGDFGKFGIIPVVLFILSNEKLTQHSFRIKIEIIDFPRLIDTLPILCLFSSMNDALYTLRSIAPKYKKIHLLLNENFMFNKDACPEELRKKIVCRSIPSAPVNRRCSRSCSTRKNSWSSKKRTASSCP